MYDLFRSLLFKLGAEPAHVVGTGAARLAQQFAPTKIANTFAYEHQALRQRIWDLDFHNPVGLAAGFDKDAKLIPFWKALGFGFVEVGSVTARPSRGNPRPRAFRLPEDRALVNRMGLNNEGAERVARRIKKIPRADLLPLGINLAKTNDPDLVGEDGIEDFRRSFRLLAPLAGYVALNISCPNTSEGKTFEDPNLLDELLSALFAERKALLLNVPILLKLSPPLSERVVFDSRIEEIIDVAQAHGVQGFIATNTASDWPDLETPEQVLTGIGRGGLSGAPIEKRATQLVRYLYGKTDGKLPIIGVGGVLSAQSAYKKIRAGASLLQLYTGLVYEGPAVVRGIKEGLAELLERDGYASIQRAIGIDVD